MKRVSVLLLMMALALMLNSGALAQDDAQTTTFQYPNLLLSTEFPSQVVGIGETVTLGLKLRSATEPQIVDLSVSGLPDDWNAAFRGKNRSVSSVFVAPEASVDLRLELPANAEPGTYAFTVKATGEGVETTLPIALTVQEKAPASLALETDLPMQRGKPSTTFRYNVTLKNEGDEDVNVSLLAVAPPFFNVVFKSGGAEVTTVPLEADGNKRLSVEVQPLLRIIPADTYPITIRAQSDDLEANIELMAEVVGESELSLTTPDGRLSGNATTGADATYRLVIQNTGTAAARNVELTASSPSGWTVTFKPSVIESIGPGEQAEVEAVVRPSEQAIAGDYVVNFRAKPEGGAQKSLEYRVTVYTSTLWGAAGVGLIALAVAVVGFAVSRFGRR